MFPPDREHTNKRLSQKLLTDSLERVFNNNFDNIKPGLVITLCGTQPNEAIAEYMKKPNLFSKCILLDTDKKSIIEAKRKLDIKSNAILWQVDIFKFLNHFRENNNIAIMDFDLCCVLSIEILKKLETTICNCMNFIKRPIGFRLTVFYGRSITEEKTNERMQNIVDFVKEFYDIYYEEDMLFTKYHDTCPMKTLQFIINNK